VLRPGQRARDVYLPAGRWRDWWNGDVAEPLRPVPRFYQQIADDLVTVYQVAPPANNLIL
jgi:hypothetical protein